MCEMGRNQEPWRLSLGAVSGAATDSESGVRLMGAAANENEQHGVLQMRKLKFKAIN